MLDWVNFINNNYMNLVAPRIKIFKLDKVKTTLDDLYNEEKYARIYLPPFEVRAFHLDMRWLQLLGAGVLTEQEENIQLVMNFENMVKTIRNLKNSHISNMYITYSGSLTPSALKTSTKFTLKKGGLLVNTYNLLDTSFNTVVKLGTAINAEDDFSVTISGKNDSSVDLVNFAETGFRNQTLQVYSKDNTYNNITDVIEYGDLVLTNAWRLYEVRNANPGGDFGWAYVQYMLTCNLIRIDQVSLPGDYEEQIKEHQYRVSDRINME